MDDAKHSPWLSGVGCAALLVVGLFHVIAGYIGIEYAAGWIGVIVATGIAAFLRTELPFMIGCYICCTRVWYWPWPIALICTAPGLLFLLPNALLAIKSFIPSRSSSVPVRPAHSTFSPPPQTRNEETLARTPNGSLKISATENKQFPGLNWEVRSADSGIEITYHPNPGPLPSRKPQPTINKAEATLQNIATSPIFKEHETVRYSAELPSGRQAAQGTGKNITRPFQHIEAATKRYATDYRKKPLPEHLLTAFFAMLVALLILAAVIASSGKGNNQRPDPTTTNNAASTIADSNHPPPSSSMPTAKLSAHEDPLSPKPQQAGLFNNSLLDRIREEKQLPEKPKKDGVPGSNIHDKLLEDLVTFD